MAQQTTRVTPTVDAACPDCEGRVEPDGHEHVCTECSAVIPTPVLETEPRFFKADDEDSRRHGTTVSPRYHDGGMWTRMGTSRERYQAAGGDVSKMYRMQKMQRRSRFEDKQASNRAYANTLIAAIASAIDLEGGIRDRAHALFAEAQSERLLKGRTLEAFAAGAMYAAIREMGLTRYPEEIAEYVGCSVSDVKLGYGVLNRELGLAAEPMQPADYIPRFASALDFPPEVEQTARAAALRMQRTNQTSGAAPSGVAGGCLYYAATEHCLGVTQADVADVTGRTPVTIRKHWQALTED